MRTLFVFLVATLAGLAFAQVTLSTASSIDLNCISGGGDAGTLRSGQKYLVRITTADSALCYSATCGDGGLVFPAGTIIETREPNENRPVSCRATGSSSGAAHFVLVP